MFKRHKHYYVQGKADWKEKVTVLFKKRDAQKENKISIASD